MGIYGHTWDKYKIENNVMELSESEMKDALLEIYSDLLEESYSEEEDVLEEGANLEMRDIWKESKKKYKKHLRACKVYIRQKDYSRASKEVDLAIKILKENKEKMRNVLDSDNVGSAIFGAAAGYLLFCLESFLPTFGIVAVGSGVSLAPTIKAASDAAKSTDVIGSIGKVAAAGEKSMQIAQKVAPIANVAKIVTTMVIIIKDIKALKKDIDEHKGEEISVKHFNLYRTKLLKYFDDAIKKAEKVRDELNNKKNAE